MIPKPINSAIRSHFDSLYNEAIEKAQSEFETGIGEVLKGLDHFGQSKIVVEALERIEEEIEESQFPYYVENHSSKEYLLNQFAGRSFLLNVDESKQLAEAITLGTRRHYLFEKSRILKESIPAFDYADFMAGVIDPYVANFDHFYKITKEEYYKIRLWQSESLLKIVTYESLMLIAKIQEHCKALASPLEFIVSEQAKIESSFDEVGMDAAKLKLALSDLFIFKGQPMPYFEDKLLEENHRFYKSDKIHWKYVFPYYVNPLLEKVDQKVEEVFGSEVSIFFTINKISEWLEMVIAGQPVFKSVFENDWKALFANIESEAASKVSELVFEIGEFVEHPEKSKKQVKQYLIGQLEKYRIKFNEFDEKHIFALLEFEDRNMLKAMFATNSYFGNDLDNQLAKIQEAIIIHEVSWEIVGYYGNIFDTNKIDYPEQDSGYIEIMALAHQMILDKGLYESMRKIQDDFFLHFETTFIPLAIHFQNHRLLLKDFFQRALERLQFHLDEAEPSSKILFMQSRLKTLRHRELEIKQMEADRYFSKGELRYSKLFMEFLEIEAQFINETKGIEFLPAIGSSKKQLAILEPPQTLSGLLSEKNETFFLKMLEDMSITTNGKSNLGERRKGVIRGVVEASIEKNILPQMSLDSLCRLVADKIGLELKAKLDHSNTSERSRKNTLRYISESL